MPRSFALGPHFETFIDAQVKGGRYNNASEVVRDALRQMEERQVNHGYTDQELRDLLEEGERSGLHPEDGFVLLGRLKDKYLKMAKDRAL